jgi:hypothetical protein
MESPQQYDSEFQHRGVRGLGVVDWVMFALTFPLSIFLLQFLTNPAVSLLDNPRLRRTFMGVNLCIEIAAAALILAKVG